MRALCFAAILRTATAKANINGNATLRYPGVMGTCSDNIRYADVGATTIVLGRTSPVISGTGVGTKPLLGVSTKYLSSANFTELLMEAFLRTFASRSQSPSSSISWKEPAKER